MNVLFVSAVLPYPLHSGGQIRIYNLLKRLSKRHRITLVSFIRNEEERSHMSRLSFCQDVHMIMRGRAWQPKYYTHAVFGKYPFLLATYDNKFLQNTLSKLMAEQSFDLMHIEPFYVYPSLPAMKIPFVVSEHNIEYEVYGDYVRRVPFFPLRPILGVDVWKLKFWETAVWKKAARLTAVSDEDAGTMRKYTDRPVSIVPNGVDLSAFGFAAPKVREQTSLLFVGNFRWHPNRDAAYMLVDRIWPRMKTASGKFTLTVVGRDVPAHLKAAVVRSGGNVLENVGNIAASYRYADILVAPHGIAGGTKFKMLEAMATGLPIITTREGAAGLGMESGTDYIEAGTTDEFVSGITRLSEDAKLRLKLSRNARTLVEKRYDWNIITDSLERVWKEVA